MLSLTAVVAAPAWPEPHPSASLPVTTVAPAALASTFLTSLTGACVFAALDLTGRGNIAPRLASRASLRTRRSRRRLPRRHAPTARPGRPPPPASRNLRCRHLRRRFRRCARRSVALARCRGERYGVVRSRPAGDHLGPGNLCRRAGCRFEEAYWRMLRGAGLLGEFLSSSRLVVIVPVACWVRPVPR